MVRTRTFDPSAALDRVVELFSSRGYSDTSMDDIVNATGVSRYGLYSTFGNKRELFEQALERYADSMGREDFLKLLEPNASLDHVRAIFDHHLRAKSKSGGNLGCMLCHTAMELAPHDSEIEDVLQRFVKRMSKAFTIGLDTAQARGEVGRHVDTKAAGDFLTSTFFGLVVMARSGFPERRLTSVVEATMRSLAS